MNLHFYGRMERNQNIGLKYMGLICFEHVAGLVYVSVDPMNRYLVEGMLVLLINRGLNK